MIASGSVFVFDEDESGIKRWTDGFFWSPSRILGNFLLYRETEQKEASRRIRHTPLQASTSPVTPDNPGVKAGDPKGDAARSLVGSLTDTYKFKSEGLMKKTFSLTIGGIAQHLISYYRISDVESGYLQTPSAVETFRNLDISPEYLDKTHFRNPPIIEIGHDGLPRYKGEAEETYSVPRQTTAPLTTKGVARRQRRHDPIASASPVPAQKRSKKKIAPAPSSPAQPTPTPDMQATMIYYPMMVPGMMFPPPPGTINPADPFAAAAGYYPYYPGVVISPQQSQDAGVEPDGED